MSKSWTAACLALALAAVPLQATAAPNVTVYKCDTANTPGISPPYIIAVDESSGLVMVMDGIINKFNNKDPVVAELVENSASRLRLRWKIDAMDSKGKRSRLVFEAVYFKKRNQFTVNGFVMGYANKFYGQGKCEIIKH